MPFIMMDGLMYLGISALVAELDALVLLSAMSRCSGVSNSMRTLLFDTCLMLRGAKLVSRNETLFFQLVRVSLELAALLVGVMIMAGLDVDGALGIGRVDLVIGRVDLVIVEKSGLCTGV